MDHLASDKGLCFNVNVMQNKYLILFWFFAYSLEKYSKPQFTRCDYSTYKYLVESIAL